jgi:hypothetical protein
MQIFASATCGDDHDARADHVNSPVRVYSSVLFLHQPENLIVTCHNLSTVSPKIETPNMSQNLKISDMFKEKSDCDSN